MIPEPVIQRRRRMPEGLRADGQKIIALIQARDAKGSYGAVPRFARRLGRHPQSLWHLRYGVGASQDLIEQIAAALKVGVDEITTADRKAA